MGRAAVRSGSFYERTGGIHCLHLREEDSTLKTEALGSPKIVFSLLPYPS